MSQGDKNMQQDRLVTIDFENGLLDILKEQEMKGEGQGVR